MSYIHDAIAVVREELPELQPGQAELYALLALTKGTGTSLFDVHDAWGIWRIASNPSHAHLAPADQLPPEVLALDRWYLAGVHRAARRLKPKEALSDAQS